MVTTPLTFFTFAPKEHTIGDTRPSSSNITFDFILGVDVPGRGQVVLEAAGGDWDFAGVDVTAGVNGIRLERDGNHVNGYGALTWINSSSSALSSPSNILTAVLGPTLTLPALSRIVVTIQSTQVAVSAVPSAPTFTMVVKTRAIMGGKWATLQSGQSVAQVVSATMAVSVDTQGSDYDPIIRSHFPGTSPPSDWLGPMTDPWVFTASVTAGAATGAGHVTIPQGGYVKIEFDDTWDLSTLTAPTNKGNQINSSLLVTQAQVVNTDGEKHIRLFADELFTGASMVIKISRFHLAAPSTHGVHAVKIRTFGADWAPLNAGAGTVLVGGSLIRRSMYPAVADAAIGSVLSTAFSSARPHWEFSFTTENTIPAKGTVKLTFENTHHTTLYPNDWAIGTLPGGAASSDTTTLEIDWPVPSTASSTVSVTQGTIGIGGGEITHTVAAAIPSGTRITVKVHSSHLRVPGRRGKHGVYATTAEESGRIIDAGQFTLHAVLAADQVMKVAVFPEAVARGTPPDGGWTVRISSTALEVPVGGSLQISFVDNWPLTASQWTLDAMRASPQSHIRCLTTHNQLPLSIGTFVVADDPFAREDHSKAGFEHEIRAPGKRIRLILSAALPPLSNVTCTLTGVVAPAVVGNYFMHVATYATGTFESIMDWATLARPLRVVHSTMSANAMVPSSEPAFAIPPLTVTPRVLVAGQIPPPTATWRFVFQITTTLPADARIELAFAPGAGWDLSKLNAKDVKVSGLPVGVGVLLTPHGGSETGIDRFNWDYVRLVIDAPCPASRLALEIPTALVPSPTIAGSHAVRIAAYQHVSPLDLDMYLEVGTCHVMAGERSVLQGIALTYQNHTSPVVLDGAMQASSMSSGMFPMSTQACNFNAVRQFATCDDVFSIRVPMPSTHAAGSWPAWLGGAPSMVIRVRLAPVWGRVSRLSLSLANIAAGAPPISLKREAALVDPVALAWPSSPDVSGCNGFPDYTTGTVSGTCTLLGGLGIDTNGETLTESITSGVCGHEDDQYKLTCCNGLTGVDEVCAVSTVQASCGHASLPSLATSSAGQPCLTSASAQGNCNGAGLCVTPYLYDVSTPLGAASNHSWRSVDDGNYYMDVEVSRAVLLTGCTNAVSSAMSDFRDCVYVVTFQTESSLPSMASSSRQGEFPVDVMLLLGPPEWQRKEGSTLRGRPVAVGSVDLTLYGSRLGNVRSSPTTLRVLDIPKREDWVFFFDVQTAVEVGGSIEVRFSDLWDLTYFSRNDLEELAKEVTSSFGGKAVFVEPGTLFTPSKGLRGDGSGSGGQLGLYNLLPEVTRVGVKYIVLRVVDTAVAPGFQSITMSRAKLVSPSLPSFRADSGVGRTAKHEVRITTADRMGHVIDMGVAEVFTYAKLEGLKITPDLVSVQSTNDRDWQISFETKWSYEGGRLELVFPQASEATWPLPPPGAIKLLPNSTNTTTMNRTIGAMDRILGVVTKCAASENTLCIKNIVNMPAGRHHFNISKDLFRTPNVQGSFPVGIRLFHWSSKTTVREGSEINLVATNTDATAGATAVLPPQVTPTSGPRGSPPFVDWNISFSTSAALHYNSRVEISFDDDWDLSILAAATKSSSGSSGIVGVASAGPVSWSWGHNGTDPVNAAQGIRTEASARNQIGDKTLVLTIAEEDPTVRVLPGRLVVRVDRTHLPLPAMVGGADTNGDVRCWIRVYDRFGGLVDTQAFFIWAFEAFPALSVVPNAAPAGTLVSQLPSDWTVSFTTTSAVNPLGEIRIDFLGTAFDLSALSSSTLADGHFTPSFVHEVDRAVVNAGERYIHFYLKSDKALPVGTHNVTVQQSRLLMPAYPGRHAVAVTTYNPATTKNLDMRGGYVTGTGQAASGGAEGFVTAYTPIFPFCNVGGLAASQTSEADWAISINMTTSPPAGSTVRLLLLDDAWGLASTFTANINGSYEPGCRRAERGGNGNANGIISGKTTTNTLGRKCIDLVIPGGGCRHYHVAVSKDVLTAPARRGTHHIGVQVYAPSTSAATTASNAYQVYGGAVDVKVFGYMQTSTITPVELPIGSAPVHRAALMSAPTATLIPGYVKMAAPLPSSTDGSQNWTLSFDARLLSAPGPSATSTRPASLKLVFAESWLDSNGFSNGTWLGSNFDGLASLPAWPASQPVTATLVGSGLLASQIIRVTALLSATIRHEPKPLGLHTFASASGEVTWGAATEVNATVGGEAIIAVAENATVRAGVLELRIDDATLPSILTGRMELSIPGRPRTVWEGTPWYLTAPSVVGDHRIDISTQENGETRREETHRQSTMRWHVANHLL